jgi:hypothetical protein
VATAVGLVAAVSLFASCSESMGDPALPSGSAGSASVGAPGLHSEPDRVLSGPQGAVAQFVVECAFSHAAFDDPIVHPGKPGESHLHVFFGNVTTDAHTTVEDLVVGDTTCNQHLDRASYWAPALLRNGVVQTPVKSVAYYRAGPDVAPTSVVPYPLGLRMIAGNAVATEPQSTAVVAWSCGAGSLREVSPPACPDQRNLRLLVTFQDCWNGVDLDSADHVSHVTYSHAGTCPPSHPVPIPQLQFSVEYPVTGPIDGLELASGGLGTGHADFYNAWDPARLEREVRNCLHRDVVCGVASGRTDG